jgi:hypothetical protein
VNGRDTKFVQHFDSVFTAAGMEILRTPPSAPGERDLREVGCHTITTTHEPVFG